MGQWSTPELEYLAGNQWQFTEKVDGTNIRIGVKGDGHGGAFVGFAGRTEAAILPPYLLEYLEDTFTEELFEKAGLNNLVLYGEGYGPKIQSGSKYGDDHRFVLFDVLINDTWLQQPDVEDIAHKLGIDAVPMLGTGTLQDAIDIVSTGLTFNDMGRVIRWGNGGLNSHWGEFEAEGIVARPVVPMFDRRGERIITKIKAVDFK